MKKRSFWISALASLLIVFGFVPATNISATAAAPTFYALDNGKIRFGTGSENSVNSTGQLQQPWYLSGTTWYKLTFSSYPLDMQISTGGVGTVDWNTNGTSINTQNGNFALTNLSVNYSGFTQTGTVGTGVKGYGTVVATGTATIGTQTFELTNTFELTASDNYIKITTKVKNTSTTTATNTRVWVGTRDDWVGNTDGPTKTKGTLSSANGFTAITSATTRAPALKIESGSEGVLFYSTSAKANTAINYCCSFTNATNQDPNTSATTLTGDGSYALFMRLADLTAGGSEEFTWYYAAGATAQLNTVINQVAQAAASWTDQTIAPTDIVNTSYSDQVTASGTGTITYAVAAGYSLPPGLSLDANTGVISGVPNTVGVYTFRITSTAVSGSTTATATTNDLVLTVGTLPVGGTTTITSPISQNVAYSSTVTATGYPSPTFSVTSGSLPAGLTLNSSTGEVAGTATTLGSSTFTITATNALGSVAFASQTVSVTAAPAFTDPTVNARAARNTAYTDGVAASGAPAPTYSIASGSLPTGLSLNTSTGAITGTPTVSGDYSFTITATNTYGSVTTSTLSIQVGVAPSEGTAQTPQTGYVGVAYSQATNVSAFPTPTFALGTGTMPPGLSLNTSTGLVSGSPTTQGVYTFTVTATNWVGSVTSSSYQITIWDKPSFTNLASASKNILLGDAYNVTLTTSGPAPTFALTSGSLPNGLSLNTATGQISGTSTASGAFTFRISATNLSGTTQSTDITINVQTVPVFSNSTITGSVFVNSSYSSSVIATGFPAPTYSINSGALPTGLSLNSSTGAITGTATATGSYTFTIRATNAAGFVNTGLLSIVVTSTPTATDSIVAANVLLGVAYSDGVTYTSFPSPTYAIKSGDSLPTGLSLNTSTGAITGTPTQTGTYSFRIDVSTPYTTVTTSVLTINVNQAPTNGSTSVISRVALGSSYSDSVSVTAYPAASFSVVSGSLPTGLSLNSSTGAITGVTTASGDYSFTIRATNSQGTLNLNNMSIQVGTLPSEPTVAAPQVGYVGKTYTQSTTVTGFPTPVFAIATGTVPPGLSLNTSTGTISGTPTSEGVYTFAVTASNWLGTITTANYQITIWDKPTFNNLASASKNIILGDNYNVTLATSGPTPTFAVTSGTLPTGVTLNASTGQLSGRSTAVGSYTFRVSATNQSGTTQSGDITVLVQTMPEITSSSVTPYVFRGQTYTSTVSSSGYPAPTYSISAGSLPTGLSINSSTGTISGTASATGTYTFTVKATNSAGFITTSSLNVVVTSLPTASDDSISSNIMLGAAYADGVSYTSYPAPSYTLRAGSALPPGISLNSVTGALVGITSQTGTYTFRIDVSTPYATVTTPPLTLNVNQAPTNGTSSITSQVPVGTAYSDQVSVSAYPAPTYSVTGGALPNGLSLNANTGAISGTATVAGDYSFTIRATNSFGTYTFNNFSIQVGSSPVEANLIEGTIQVALDENGQATFTAPAGAVFVTSNLRYEAKDLPECGARIYPVVANQTTVTISADNGTWGDTCGGLYKQIIGTLYYSNGSNDQVGFVGRNYSDSTRTTGFPLPAFSIASGSLPGGLNLTSSGRIEGTPTTEGVFRFRVRAENWVGTVVTTSYTITIWDTPKFSNTTSLDATLTEGDGYGKYVSVSGPDPRFEIASGSLPNGLSLNWYTGEISGIATDYGTYTFAIRAINDSGSSESDPITIVVRHIPTIIDDEVVSAALVDEAYNDGVSVLAYPSATYVISSGSLPPGVSLDENSGELSGTPSATGTYRFKIRATNDAGTVETEQLQILIASVPTATDLTLANDATLGEAYSDGISYSAYPAPTYSLNSGNLPTGLSLNPITGALTGVALDTGRFDFTILVNTGYASVVTDSLTIETVQAPSTQGLWVNPRVGLQTSYSSSVAVPAYPAPTYEVIGALPPGLSLDSETGEISGIATQVGDYNFKIAVSNRIGSSTSDNVSIQVGVAPSEPYAAIPENAFIGRYYSKPTTVYAYPLPTFSVDSGVLPGGLSLDSQDGSLSGTPTETGNFSFTIKATNWVGAVTTRSYNISVWDKPSISNAIDLSSNLNEGQSLSRTLSVSGPNPVFAVASGTLPPGLSLNSETGELSGTVTAFGDYAFRIAVTNLSGTSVSDEITIVVRSLSVFTRMSIAPVVFVGEAYRASVNANAYPAPTYSVVNGYLPLGLVLDSATGVISGTPSKTGTYEFAIAATNPAGVTTSRQLSILVTSKPQPIDQQISSSVLIGNSFYDAVSFASYPAPTYSVSSGRLPAGLTLDQATGQVTGMPTEYGTFSFAITASTEFSSTTTDTLTLNVNQAPQIDDQTIAATSMLGAAFDDGVSVRVYPAASFSISSGQLPPGLSLDSATGKITGVTTEMGDYSFVISATNSIGKVDFPAATITVNSAPIAVDADVAPKGLVGTNFSDGITFAAWQPAVYSVSKGTLPPGLALDGLTGSLTGTPTKSGIYTFSLTASNSFGSVTLPERLVIEQSTSITSGVMPNAIMGVNYSFKASATGYPTPTFSIVDGSLPEGLDFNSKTGDITGVPQQSGTFNFAIQANNGTPSPAKSAQVLVITEPEAKIILKATVGKPVEGSEVEVDTKGAKPSADYGVTLYSTPRILDQGKVAPDGTINARMEIPADLEPGWHHIELISTFPNGKKFVKKTYFEITATQLLETPPQEEEPTPAELSAALTNDNEFYKAMGIDPASAVSAEEAGAHTKTVATVVASLALVSTAAAAAASIASASSAVTASSMLGGATSIPVAPTAPTAPTAPASGGAATGGSTSGNAGGGTRTGGSGSAGGSSGGSGSGGRSDSNSNNSKNSSQDSSSDSDDGGYGSLEGFLDDYTDDRVAWGDRLAIWKLKFMTFLDMVGYNLAVKLSPFSPVAGKIVNDGAYLRAILGSLAYVPSFVAIFLGAMSVTPGTTNIYTALNVGVFMVVIAIGALDSLAGFLGAMTVVGLSLFHYGWQDDGTGRYLLTMAMLGFAPMILSTTFRKIRRPRMSTVMDVWERVADLAVIAFISALTTISLVKTVGALAQVTLEIGNHAVAIAASIAFLAMIRVVLEEIAAGVFTARMEKINPTSIVEGSATQEWFSLFLKYGVLCYMIAPLVGIGWHLWIGSAVIFLPGLLSLLRIKFPTSKLIYQLMPGGIASLLAATLLSGWSGTLISNLFQALPNFKELAYVLTPLPVIAMALLGMFAEPGEKWYQKLKFSRTVYLVGGIAVFIMTVLATGFLSQMNL